MSGHTEDFATLLSRRALETQAALEALLSDAPRAGETMRPPRLVAAMRHGALNGGKRLRPFLVIETAAMFGARADHALRAAAALECVHCYSLVHDDLPAMDDDDLRRGQPTVHKAFDEATAILAGDALLTLAFDVLADEATHPDAAVRSALVLSLARASGVGGMAGGQALDLEAEGRGLSQGEIATLQAMKTGALFRHACEAGAILGRASAADRAAMLRFGDWLGKAFQLADDLLDVTASAATLGKQSGKDEGRGKATLVALHGVERSRLLAAEYLDRALAEIEPFGDRARYLAAAARFGVGRDH